MVSDLDITNDATVTIASSGLNITDARTLSGFVSTGDADLDALIRIDEAARAHNTSGFDPLDLRVLVLPDAVKTKTDSGIHLPDSIIEQDKFAQTKATLIAVGDNAWEEAKARAPGFRPPVPGDRILYGKYSGQRLTGDDGKEYIIMNDEDVLARLSEGS